MSRINALTIAAAEAQAVELDSKGEKWGAHAIVSLLAIIEDLTAEPKAPAFSPEFIGKAARLQKSILERLGEPVPKETLDLAAEGWVD